MEPLVTTIIPCYNGARFLDEALASVLAQSYANQEVIVVDDGSTDNSGEIAARYADVRYIRQKNSGVAAARNTGIRHSRGDYIVLLDQDDRLLPCALESNLRCLLDRPECAFAFGDAQSIDAYGSPLPHGSSCPHEGTDHYLSLLQGNYIWTPGVAMYRRQLRDGLLRFDTAAEPSDDFDLNLRVARKYAAFHNNAVVLEYRVHDTSMGRRHALMLESGVTVVRRQNRWVQRDLQSREAISHGLRFVENYYGNLLFTQILADIRYNRNWRQTYAGLGTLLRYAPFLPWRRAVHRARRLLTAGQ
jgi:glycosyltransferase involved in cell wall biosynthesis